MSRPLDSTLPSDISLLLRADAEQCWLHREVLPVLRQVETPEELPNGEVDAALAYLEAMWNEATVRARETDAAHRHLCARDEPSETLAGPAGRYHTAVRALREIVADRMTPFVDPTQEVACEQRRAGAGGVRVTDARAGGCAPRAA